MTTGQTTADNPFSQAETWEVSTGRDLPEGNYVVTITETDDATSGNFNPKLVLRMENEQGTKTDHVPYHENFLAKVVSVFDAAGVERPQVGEFDPADHCRLTPECRQRLVDKKVGIVVRNESDREDPNKQWSRVKGYVSPDQIEQDAPAQTAGLPESGAQANAPKGNEPDIPF